MKSEKSLRVGQEIVDVLFSSNRNAIKIGKIGKFIRDEKCYLDYGYETFNQWLSSTGIMPRTARRYITIVEKYIDELKVEEERLYSITPARLEKMIPFANSENVDEWLSRAETCSNKDFIDLVNEEIGHSSGIIEKRIWGGTETMSGESPTGDVGSNPTAGVTPTAVWPRYSPKEYMAIVKKADCVLCPGKKNKGVGHHFPQRRRRGEEWKVIPLCAECHIEADGSAGDASFWLKYKGKLVDWFYNLIVKDET